MRKTISRIVAILIAITFVFTSISGCGKKESPSETVAPTVEESSVKETIDESNDYVENNEEDIAEEETDYDEGSSDPYDFVPDAIKNITYEVDLDADKDEAIDLFWEDYDNSKFSDMYYGRAYYGDNEYPEHFDLRDYGVVTPVKTQEPWGACWTFGVCAACETSILSEAGTTYEETGLDLSEHHVAWYAQSHVTEDGPQKGEGIYFNMRRNPMDDGGFVGLAASIFADGVGPELEENYPYRDKSGKRNESGDWSLPDSGRFSQAFQLEEAKFLHNIMNYDEDNGEWEYDTNAIEQIKDELMAGRGVAVAYEFGHYSEAYGHYSDNDQYSADHVVCIVGWDDNFPVENYEYTNDSGEKDPMPKYPGAWIVKNSWGAETEGAEVGHNRFGLENEKGEVTGYFYLSYEDHSANQFMSFDFDIENTYEIQQHDLMQTTCIRGWEASTPYSMANVFSAKKDENLECVSVNTSTPNTVVRYSVYLMDEEDVDPTDGVMVSQVADFYEDPGVHRERLDDEVPLVEGQKYAVVVDAYTNNDNCEGFMVYGNESQNKKMYADDGNNYPAYAVGIVNPGESYLYSGAYKCWIDYADIVDSRLYKTWDMDNFPIKAYTK